MTNLAEELKNIIVQGARKYPMPFKKGNSIFIGTVVIRPSKQNGYLLYDTKESEHITTTYSKYGALAVAKLYMYNKDIEPALYQDKTLQKYDNDCLFYKHMIENSDNQFRIDTAKVRLEISQAFYEQAVEYLEQIIFENDK